MNHADAARVRFRKLGSRSSEQEEHVCARARGSFPTVVNGEAANSSWRHTFHCRQGHTRRYWDVRTMIDVGAQIHIATEEAPPKGWGWTSGVVTQMTRRGMFTVLLVRLCKLVAIDGMSSDLVVVSERTLTPSLSSANEGDMVLCSMQLVFNVTTDNTSWTRTLWEAGPGCFIGTLRV